MGYDNGMRKKQAWLIFIGFAAERFVIWSRSVRPGKFITPYLNIFMV